MTTRARLAVSPAVLEWARTTAGHDIESAAKAIGVSTDRLTAWESGGASPTINQLRKAAQRYNRSLAALMLPEPPDETPMAVADFRAPPQDGALRLSASLRSVVVRAERQREALLEIVDAAESMERPEPITLRISMSEGAEASGAKIRQYLRLDELSDKERLRPRECLSKVIAMAEERDIVVIQTQRIPISEMRGFSLSADLLPVVALNGGDAQRGKLFTLLHEVAHLGLRVGGVCDLHESRHADPTEDIEAFCNGAAASALMARAEVEAAFEEHKSRSRTWTAETMRDFGASFGASAEAALLRLITLGLEPWSLYRDLKPKIDAAVAEARRVEQARRQESTGGPSFYVMKARDMGRSYVTRVIGAFDDDAISSRDVARFLEVRFDQVSQLRKAVGE